MLRRGAWLLGIALALVALAVAALVALTPRDPGVPTLAGRIEAGTLRHEDLERSWLAYLPAELPASPALVFVLHGSSHDAETMRKLTRYRFEKLADRDGFIPVYAEAWERGGPFGLTREWNDCRKATDLAAHRRGVDDVGFLQRLAARFSAERGVDPARIYAVGFSDGGQLSLRLAAERPELFAAVAAVAAQQPTLENTSCAEPDGRVPVLIMNGTADPIVPFDGGDASLYGLFSAGPVLSMRDSLAYWRAAAGVEGPGDEEWLADSDPGDHSSVERMTWRGAGGVEVTGYAIRGGGHTFPGGWQYFHPIGIGYTNGDINAADEIWRFFQRHPLPR